MGAVGDVKDGYELIKEVGKDAWDFGSGLAPYVFGEKDIISGESKPTSRMEDAHDPDENGMIEPYKPTSGNETFDSVLEFFL